MGQRFVVCDREQSFLMPPDVREWLPERHLAWFVIDLQGRADVVGHARGVVEQLTQRDATRRRSTPGSRAPTVS